MTFKIFLLYFKSNFEKACLGLRHCTQLSHTKTYKSHRLVGGRNRVFSHVEGRIKSKQIVKKFFRHFFYPKKLLNCNLSSEKTLPSTSVSSKHKSCLFILQLIDKLHGVKKIGQIL